MSSRRSGNRDGQAAMCRAIHEVCANTKTRMQWPVQELLSSGTEVGLLNEIVILYTKLDSIYYFNRAPYLSALPMDVQLHWRG